mmetsp:Transcript_38159/g.96562  ORF Transcript_38159/g.96562 Transcript_38159/m.96562 type:complete len:293 (+) Transcript_38159:398-1276(+)
MSLNSTHPSAWSLARATTQPRTCCTTSSTSAPPTPWPCPWTAACWRWPSRACPRCARSRRQAAARASSCARTASAPRCRALGWPSSQRCPCTAPSASPAPPRPPPPPRRACWCWRRTWRLPPSGRRPRPGTRTCARRGSARAWTWAACRARWSGPPPRRPRWCTRRGGATTRRTRAPTWTCSTTATLAASAPTTTAPTTRARPRRSWRHPARTPRARRFSRRGWATRRTACAPRSASPPTRRPVLGSRAHSAAAVRRTRALAAGQRARTGLTRTRRDGNEDAGTSPSVAAQT